MEEGTTKRAVQRWKRVGVSCALILSVCVWVWLKETSFSEKGALVDIALQEVADEKDGVKPSGSAIFTAPAPPVFARMGFYMLPSGVESNFKLFEDDQLMYRVGRMLDLDSQAYVHFPDRVCFILSANSDPRTNDHTYTFRATYFLRLRYQVALCALMLLSGIGLGLAGCDVPFGDRQVGPDCPKRGRLRVLFDFRPLVLLAAFLASFLFFLGRNAFFYSYNAIFASLGVLLCLAVGLSLLLFVLRWIVLCLVDRISGRVSEGVVFRLRLLPDALWACAACCVFVLLCGFAIGDSFLEWLPQFSSLLFCASISSALVAAAVLRWGIRTLNAFLFSFLVVTSVTFLGGLLWEGDGQEVASPLEGKREITLTSKPNIYVFLLESYAGSDAMREFYGIDATPFYQELGKRGFRVRDTYANQIFSIGSASSLMMMRHLDVEKWRAGLFDTQRGVRAMLSGAAYNPVLDTLKRNGYRISFLQRDYYLCPQPSPAVDVTNLSYNNVIRNFQPLIDATGILVKTTMGNVRQRPLEQLDAEIMDRIQQSLDRPTFHFIYTGLEHNMPREANSESRSRWKNVYRGLRATFNPRLLALLDFIGEVDPSGLIVLIGDHGSKLFGHDFTIASPSYPALAKSGVCNPETIARDQASILFAIKTPVTHPVWENRLVTHVNLFRYLFATLSGDESLLDHPEPDVSLVWTGRYTIARDGHPLKKWEPIDPGLFKIAPLRDEQD